MIYSKILQRSRFRYSKSNAGCNRFENYIIINIADIYFEGGPVPNYRLLGQMLGCQLVFFGIKHVLKIFRKGLEYWRERSKEKAMIEEDNETPPDDIESLDKDEVTFRNVDSSFETEETENPQCVLCFNDAQDLTVTPCGHMLCWECAIQWCATKPDCPLCRQHVELNRLVRVYNYAIS